MSDITTIPPKREGAELRVVIETPRGSRYKYAFDVETKALELKTMLARGLSFPYDYGFVPQTLADDGDPADVLLIMEEPVHPLSVVRARLLGGFGLTKDGTRNDRLLARPLTMKGVSTSTDAYESLDDLSPEELQQIERFLSEYSEEQGHDIRLLGRYGPDEAIRLVDAWHRAWRERPG